VSGARRPSRQALQRLGDVAVDRFVRNYWQRRPLLIRQAIPDFRVPVTAARLFELACHPDVESRLVSRTAGRWRVQHGPFEQGALPLRRKADWTLLVQGVDLHDADAAALGARFRFLPAARFDDVMISYAADRGGVGPHVDQYDVFLLQAQGRRRWRIARNFDERLVAGLPLRVLAHFRHEHEWLLEPGDLLYLPPGVAHEGVALGECITVSIGFRVPLAQELAEAWADRRAREMPLEGRLADGTRRATRAPARLPTTLVDAALHQLRRIVPTRKETQRMLLEHLTEPKPTVYFTAPSPAMSRRRFDQAARTRGLRLDLRSRMLYEGRDFAINGELLQASAAAGPWLRKLADDGALAAENVAGKARARELPEQLLALAHAWYRFGWIHLAVK
jgi:50S ribosomal protein L16 3-hydroxylase